MRPVITCYGYALPIFAGLFRCFGAKGLGLRKGSRARCAAKARVAPAPSLLGEAPSCEAQRMDVLLLHWPYN